MAGIAFYEKNNEQEAPLFNISRIHEVKSDYRNKYERGLLATLGRLDGEDAIFIDRNEAFGVTSFSGVAFILSRTGIETSTLDGILLERKPEISDTPTSGDSACKEVCNYLASKGIKATHFKKVTK